MPITDRLAPGMVVLFIGFNPSLTSAARGFNYAGRNNRFYRVLYLSGLTARQYRPEESPSLLDDYQYGFTNIVARPSKCAADISAQEFAEGGRILAAKLRQYRPVFACYVGKGVYQQFLRQFPRRRGVAVPWGFQADSLIPGVCDFVAPSTSGLVRMRLSEQTAIYRELAQAAQRWRQQRARQRPVHFDDPSRVR
ncbi:mismatch-specific DNA-glycosylase [Alicyclobacillus kakegawensis]|uniref:mismatch-specific DNA-glycosylase n=1 Tax=Alicyclobacillus kakegawensis TaxID=392012 RepID=UPI000B29085D|nr:mismatch-specific DNA-glycosylase [Alicyclobacillus kakegawensis]